MNKIPRCFNSCLAQPALRQPFPAEQHGLKFGGANSHHFFVQSCSNMTAQKLGLLRAVSPTPENEPPPVIPRHPPSTKRAKDCIPGNRSQSQTHPSGCHTEKCDWSLLHGSTVQWWRVSTTTCMQRFAKQKWRPVLPDYLLVTWKKQFDITTKLTLFYHLCLWSSTFTLEGSEGRRKFNP